MANIRRRTVLKSFGAVASTALGSTSAQSAPPIVQSELTPQQFGASGGDATADTLGWNRAVAEGARLGRPVMASGTYVLRAPAKSRWNWFRRPSATTHVAVQLHSHTRIFAKNCTILVGRPEVPPISKDERHILFGTDESIESGALTDIEFEGLTFDFREEFGPVHSFTYAVGIVGVDDFKRRNVTVALRLHGDYGERGPEIARTRTMTSARGSDGKDAETGGPGSRQTTTGR